MRARSLLRPLLKLLFGRGLSRSVLSTLCDEAYVEAAAEKLRKDKGESTLKGIAELSGLSLARVRRFRDLLREHAKTYAVRSNEPAPLIGAATRVVTGWYSDVSSIDAEGRPLPARPDSRLFKHLVHRYGNGFTASSIAGLLLSTESVKLNDQGEFEPQGRHVLAAPHSEELDHSSLEAFVDLARAVEINQRKLLTHTGLLQRTCANDRMPKRMAPLFKNMIRQNTQSFLETIDDWLVQHEVNSESMADADSLVRLGVGVYVIADE